jgi:hypothetical protein
MRRVRASVPPGIRPSASVRPLEAPSALNRAAADMPSPAATAALDASAGPTEIVVRPSGLRHGRWEAPQWAFWTVGSVVVVLAVVYALARLGYFGKKPG